MNSNIIQERQNDEALLKIQYAARVSFNSAEKFHHFAWIACIVSAFSVFLPSSWPMYIINGIPCIADIFAFLFSIITSQKVNLASTLRKYFDSYVLDIPRPGRSGTGWNSWYSHWGRWGLVPPPR